MTKTCPDCKHNKLKCLKCINAGAFGKDAEGEFIHTGECMYENCGFCQEKHDLHRDKYHTCF